MRDQRPFPPYATPDKLAKGKRKTILTLFLAVGAALLAAVAQSVVDDQRLATVYVAASILWTLVGLGEALRWSNTGEFERVEQRAE